MEPSVDSPSALLKEKQTKAIASKTFKTTTASSPRTPAKRSKTEDSGDDGTPRKKVARKSGLNTETPFPKTFDTMSAADRLLWDMREAKIGYEVIAPQYVALANLPTDKPLGVSTLPNRQGRLLDLFQHWNAEEDMLLVRCEAAVSNIYEKQKWNWIKEMMDIEGKKLKEYQRSWGLPGLLRRWEELNGGGGVGDGDGEREGEGDEAVVVSGKEKGKEKGKGKGKEKDKGSVA